MACACLDTSRLATLASSLPEGAFDTRTFCPDFLFVFCLSAIAFIEPRDYRVVFVIQQKARPIGFAFLFCGKAITLPSIKLARVIPRELKVPHHRRIVVDRRAIALLRLLALGGFGFAKTVINCFRSPTRLPHQKMTVILIQNCSHFFIHYGVMVYHHATCLRAYHQKERENRSFLHIITL